MSQSAADAYLNALSGEHSKARECVAALRAYLACGYLNIRASSLYHALGTCASDRLVMTIGRVLDDDADTITAVSFCRYIEQNPRECAWAFSDDGRKEHPNPKAHVCGLARKWASHWTNHPLHSRIKHSRDKTIAHLDKKQWLGQEELGEIRVPEVEQLLDDFHRMLNEFGRLISKKQFVDLVFPIVSMESAMTIAGYEYWLKSMESGIINREEFFERVDQIKAALERYE